MHTIRQLVQRDSVMKILLLATLVLFAYLIRSILNLILLTFMIAYLANSLQSLLIKQINKVIKVNPAIITIIIYLFMTITVVMLAVKYIPLAIYQSLHILKRMEFTDFAIDTKGNMKYLAPI